MIESSTIETAMYQVGQLFLLPVLALVALLFLYALYALGGFAVQAWQRRDPQAPAGYPLRRYVQQRPTATEDELDLVAHRLLEKERLASRIAPMLGLVGTMIPMGPALRALADGNLARVSDSLTVAFSAVILALIAASITYWVSNIRRRWLAEELVALQRKGAA
ncbi:MAG TPA: MotA/TolQ/ExbB proton channel family protein [Ramlibacter sp.]|jgi:biopolymer transport protein ExbB/TolQ|uniref:MotA/TolQ/ExbB proton channel family protein n=1 Tax=Ramlibacter sp. TaxID=1917967 RepID=UPI002D67F2ED|nr:MotA/TolQ/ExbB proton channel family protein [Ramlibacter sp.]HZY20737.1 MotA/TolQ/ExbB proton channel family protein [Ramlibacter sp.]